jgi:hypothetical protein
MKTLQRLLMGLGTFLLLAVALQLIAPKTVHAVVSTLVTVANTASNPVLTLSVDNPARTPFHATATCQEFNSDQCFAQDFLAIPPGMTAVVQDVSGYCRVQNNEGALGIPLHTDIFSHNGGAIELSMDPVVPDSGGLFVYHFSRPVTMYVPSTAAAPDTLNFGAVMLFGVDCTVLVNGYYVANGQ